MPVSGTVSSQVPWLFTPADVPFYIALNADLNGIASAITTITPFPTPTRAGDIMYATGSTASTWTSLAGNTSGTQFLQETSVGVPSWATPAAGGALVSINTYASTQTITIPSTATKAAIYLVGGGGGGGSTNVAASGMGGAPGGGGGALFKYLSGLTSGNTLALTVGSVGTAGAASAGGAGGNSSLASGTQVITTLTANGGAGGPRGTNSFVAAGGAGGTATNGDINITGQTSGSVNQAAAPFSFSMGTGTGFGFGIGAMLTVATDTAGAAGTGFGAGGTGGMAFAAADKNGGAGTVGICKIFWFT